MRRPRSQPFLRGAIFACCASLTTLSGCGTIASRGQRSWFGAYPFQGVGVDLVFLSKTFDAPQDFLGMKAPGSFFLFWGLVSLPFDLVVDAVALPLDVGGWIFGVHKTPDILLEDRYERDADDPDS